MTLHFGVSEPHPTLTFAAGELRRYLRKAGFVGSARFSLELIPSRNSRPDEDRIVIRAEGAKVRLGGSNPRSVLFAVYRYLHQLGFRWIRPGARGEIIPRLKRLAAVPPVDERASYRYRTICIEGATSEQHARDLVDWMAKQGLNGYFVQFDYATEFWRRWYRHEGNPRLKPEPFHARRVRAMVDALIPEIHKRGLRFERMGHGWTCAALGIEGETWEQTAAQVAPARRPWLAKVNGKRALFHGVALNTNLCYSNIEARETMLNAIVQYAKTHPDVEGLHLWLADGSNNQCECARCAATRPADFYVRLLNDLDRRLTAEKLGTKIVFLIYVDLLWPPVRERLRNPARFILMFAPITRSYLQSFPAAARHRAAVAPYRRNRLQFPAGAAENLAYLRLWQRGFKGDGFDFDYHMLWACFFDLAMFTMARTLYADLRGLSSIGLDGFNSCQNQRMSFPHNLLMDTMARTLWNRRTPFRRIVRESFHDAFGRDAGHVVRFLETLSRLGQPFFEAVHAPKPDTSRIRAGLRNLPPMAARVSAFRPTVRRNLARSHEPAVRWSWKYLAAYLDLMDRLVPAYDAYLRRAPDTPQRFEPAFDYLWKQEPRLHPALDVCTLVRVLKWRVAEAAQKS